jgi:hypothetical protein
VSVDGFFECTGPKSKRQLFWIHRREGGLLLFAILYEACCPQPRRPELTFTIVTCAANMHMAEIHDSNAGRPRPESGRGLDEPERAQPVVARSQLKRGLWISAALVVHGCPIDDRQP